jgi:pimeloyl-ACP methyl ester carboxylesterase
MLYPYLQIFWPFLNGTHRPLALSYAEGVPQLFLYGGRKRVMFHTPSYLDRLAANPASGSKVLPESGHWLHWTHPDAVAHEMKLFFRR